MSSPPGKKPKTFWIAAVTTATVVGSAFNSFTDGPSQKFHFLNEGFFSENTYAGGADKASHFASYYIVAQLLGNVYEGLGMTRDNAQLLSAGVSAFAGFVTELGDGRGHYGFSYEDFVFDVLSAATYLGIHHYGLEDLVGFSFGPIPAQPKPRRLLRNAGLRNGSSPVLQLRTGLLDDDLVRRISRSRVSRRTPASTRVRRDFFSCRRRIPRRATATTRTRT